jgi:transposase
MRRSRAEWSRQIALWRKSGLTARQYAAEAGLNAGTLKYWKYALGREARGGSGTKANLPLIEVRSSVKGHDGFEVELAGGRRVRVPVTFDEEALRRLLAVLEVAS